MEVNVPMSPGVPVAAADGMRIVPGSEAVFVFLFFAQPIGGLGSHHSTFGAMHRVKMDHRAAGKGKERPNRTKDFINHPQC